MTQPIFLVDGVDMSAHLKGVSGVTPTGPGSIGRADFFLDKQAGGLTILNMARVQWYFPHTGSSGIRANGRVFDGLIVNRDTSARADTKLWRLTCSDMNLALDFVVRDADPAHSVNISAGDFSAQIAQCVQIVQENGGGTVALAIDATTYVANLYTSTMPAVVLPPGKSLRFYIKAICDAAVVLDPAINPRFFVGMGTTFSIGDVFGPPNLHVYDGNLEPAALFTFDETNIIDDTFRRVTESTRMVQRRQAVYGEGWIATYAEAASAATYPNPLINHGLTGNMGYFMAEPVEDRESLTNAQAVAKLTRQVKPVAYPRETIYLVPSDEANIVKPGDVIDLTWALEGLANAIKRAASVSYTFEPPDKLVTAVQANSRRLKLYEDGEEGESAPPEEGDVVRPNPPTDVTADDTLGIFEPTRGMTAQPITWTPSDSLDVVGYNAYAVQGVYNLGPVFVPDRTATGATLMLIPGVVYSITVKAKDSSGNESIPSDPPATGTAAEPDPSLTLYNGGYETKAWYNTTLPDGWLVTLGGGAAVVLDETIKHSGVRAVKIDCTSATGGTSASLKSRFKSAVASVRYRFSLWARGGSAASILTAKAHYYTNDLALISTTTLATNAAVTTSWAQYTWFDTAPSGTRAIKVEVADNVAASAGFLWVDDWEAEIEPATSQPLNPSFEIANALDGTLPADWERVVAASGTAVRDSSTQSEGTYSAKLSNTAGGSDEAGLKSSYFVLPSVAQRQFGFLEFWAKTSNTGTNVTAIFTTYDPDYVGIDGAAYTTVSTSTNWTRYQYPIELLPGYAFARVYFRNATPSRDVWIDAVSFDDDTTRGSETGAVDRSLHEKLYEALSVKDFGATGDGTTDDTDAVQKAIDAAKVGTLGKTLLIPEGEYVIGSTISIDSVQGFIMKGEGHSVKFVWDGNDTTPMFDIVDSRNYDIGDFQIISSTGAQLSVGIQVRRSGASPTVVPRMGTFRNIFMQGTDGGLDTGYIIGGASHYDANTDFNTFVNCEVNNYKFYGWAISGSQLYGNTFHNCNAFGFTGALSAVWITSSGGYFTWKGGVVYGNAIDFHNEATTHTTYQPMLIEGVVSENSERFVDWDTKGHLIIEGCRWSGNAANNDVEFLRMTGGGTYLVHDNLFGDGFAGTGNDGLRIEIPDEQTRLTFHSNTLMQDAPHTMSQLWKTYGPDEEWNNRWMDESTVQYTPLTEHSTGFADGDATPDVMGHRLYYTVNTGATTITDITFLHASKAKAGKQITILFTDALTTLAHNTHIKLAGAANRTFAANDIVELFWGGTYWIQVSGSAGGAIPDGVLPRYARAATTLSITLSGTQTADGVALIAGDKCLVRVQSTGSQNGLYVVSAGAWTRATDSDTSAKMPSGSLFQVTEGSTNGDALFAITTNNPIVLGTTALTFTRLTRKHTSVTAGTYNRVTVDDFGQVTAGFTNRGAALPGSPTTGDEFFYTGSGKNVWVYWDGTRWLGPEFLYAWHDYVISPQPYTANTNPHIAGLPQDYALYMKRLDIAWYEVTGDASNFWTIEVWKLAGGGATKVATTTTAAGAGPWTLNSNVSFVGGTNPLTLGDFLLYTAIVKTGAPGNLYYTITLFAQKIFT